RIRPAPPAVGLSPGPAPFLPGRAVAVGRHLLRPHGGPGRADDHRDGQGVPAAHHRRDDRRHGRRHVPFRAVVRPGAAPLRPARPLRPALTLGPSRAVGGGRGGCLFPPRAAGGRQIQPWPPTWYHMWPSQSWYGMTLPARTG